MATEALELIDYDQTDLAFTLRLELAAALESGAAGGEGPSDASRAEVQATLEALGYETLEVHRALRAVAAAGLAADAPIDDWIRDGLRWLARAAA
jgi:Holliday junction DNA helicase RuvA